MATLVAQQRSQCQLLCCAQYGSQTALLTFLIPEKKNNDSSNVCREEMAGKGSLTKLDVGVLSPEQQEKLHQFKVQTRIDNERYLRSHPEVDQLIGDFLRCEKKAEEDETQMETQLGDTHQKCAGEKAC